jgi:hypothetical protein
MLNSSVKRQCLIFLSLAAVAAAQQTRSAIQGRVFDPQGSLITNGLDVARFAVSEEYKLNETRPNAWRYRDYLIDVFNADKRYDPCIREQIGGNEMGPRDLPARIATGFNRSFADESQRACYETLHQVVAPKSISGRRPFTYRRYR